MRRFILAAAAMMMAGAGLAYAGPEPISDKEMKQVVPQPECPNTWTGFYVGARAGYGFNTGDATADPLPSQFDYDASGLRAYTRSPDADGFVGGGEVGYNWQNDHFMVGIETDFSGSTMDGRSTVSPIDEFPFGSWGPGSYVHLAEDIEWLGTIRARFGLVPIQRLLIYATGGLAYAHMHLDGGEYDNVTFHFAGREATDIGWVAGGGIEYALNCHWSIKTEYLYFGMGDHETNQFDIAFGQFPVGERYTFHTQFNTVTGGLNYKF